MTHEGSRAATVTWTAPPTHHAPVTHYLTYLKPAAGEARGQHLVVYLYLSQAKKYWMTMDVLKIPTELKYMTNSEMHSIP